MAITVGASLSVDESPEARKLSLALSAYIERLHSIARDAGLTPATQYACRPDARVFKEAGVPTTNTATESPGQDMCFVVDTTNNDLYLIYSWASSTSFTALKILDATGS